jgi:XTP/dITP diphosphohydrolase
MADFLFVTSNHHKVQTARAVCTKFDIDFTHQSHDLTEIQADDGEIIARDKAHQAFEYYQKPVAVTDDNWLIPGLNGFPGPYMKYMNQWLKPQDFVNLTRQLKDRRIIMRQIIAYRNADREKVFSVDIPAVLLKEPRGKSEIPHFAVISFDGGQHSAAEIEASGQVVIADQANAWHEFCQWFVVS